MSDITRSEAIDVIESIMRKYEEDECICCDIMLGDEDYEALRLARDSLKTDEAYNLMYEQPEFCEDCISRESAQLCLTGENLPENRNEYIALVSKRLRKLPSILPNFIEPVIRDNGVKDELEPTTKNDLVVDAISRTQAQTKIEMNASRYTIARERGGMGQVEWSDQLIKVSDAVDIIRNLPPVTPQEPQTFKWCTDCREYDQEKHCCHRWSKVIRNTVEEMKQEYIEREVLDKIRAEIAEYGSIMVSYAITKDTKTDKGIEKMVSDVLKEAKEQVLEIIDKYRAESEK